MKEVQHICVAGGGSWGTALAHHASLQGHKVTLLLRDANVCTAINERHENSRYLPGCALLPSLAATTDPQAEGALGSPVLILAIPCQQQRSYLTQHRHLLSKNVRIANAAKGIELDTGLTCSQLFAELVPDLRDGYAVLSGPSFAREVMDARPTAVAIASSSPSTASFFQDILSSSSFRCYTSDDVLGVELGGAVKNVIAIACGICDGLEVGTNGRAALITRGLAEMSRLGQAMGAKEHTFQGLSGLGDLVLTATGSLSRNRTLGLALGRGQSLKEAGDAIGMVTEGVKTAFAVSSLAARLYCPVPITNAVCDILSGTLSASEAVYKLMNRSLIQE